MAATGSDGGMDGVMGLADRSGIGLIRFDRQLVVVLASSAAYAALERPPDGLVGRTAMEAFVDHRLEELVVAAAAGTPGESNSDRGSGRNLVFRAQPAGDGGAWVSIEDVTELRRLRRIRSELIDDLSHELRTPLANIRLLAEVLEGELAGADVPDRVRRRVVTIEAESAQLARMVDEMLELARIEQDGLDLRLAPLDVIALIGGVVARSQSYADHQDVRLQTRLAADPPMVAGDAERLGTLLSNLVDNAIKFSFEGGTVVVGADAHPGSVQISVSDQGIGIPEADRERVFERFYMVDRARHRGQGGTGLGLAIAMDIAVAHGTRIRLVSGPHAGSTFSFELPVA